MLLRIAFAGLLGCTCLLCQVSGGMSAHTDTVNTAKGEEADIETEPLITQQELKCLEARKQVCARKFQQCEQEQSNRFGLGFNVCFQIKLGCLEDCKKDYANCKNYCSAHYVSGCRKKCRKARKSCYDICEKNGTDCTSNAASSKPITRPKEDCKKSKKECEKIVRESCLHQR